MGSNKVDKINDSSDEEILSENDILDQEPELEFLSMSINELFEKILKSSETPTPILLSNLQKLDAISLSIDDSNNNMLELDSMVKRAHADHQNYKKRKESQIELNKNRVVESILVKLFDLRDSLNILLDQNQDESNLSGINAIMSHLDSILFSENISLIIPEIGDETDPNLHEVLSHIQGIQNPDTIESIIRVGYMSELKILRPAQVIVSSGGSGN
jgi:molecular chaperone GrpE